MSQSWDVSTQMGGWREEGEERRERGQEDGMKRGKWESEEHCTITETDGHPPGVLSREIAFDVKSKTEERAAGQETSPAGWFDGFWCFGRCDSVIFFMFCGSLVFSVACFAFGGQCFWEVSDVIGGVFLSLLGFLHVLRWFLMSWDWQLGGLWCF